MNCASRYSLDEFESHKAARAFRIKVYKMLRQVPSSERRCLEKQMRRAAVSVTNSIAEGHGRWHYLENMRFCRIARGSIAELIDDFDVCLDEDFVEEDLASQLKQDADFLITRSNGDISHLKPQLSETIETRSK